MRKPTPGMYDARVTVGLLVEVEVRGRLVRGDPSVGEPDGFDEIEFRHGGANIQDCCIPDIDTAIEQANDALMRAAQDELEHGP